MVSSQTSLSRTLQRPIPATESCWPRILTREYSEPTRHPLLNISLALTQREHQNRDGTRLQSSDLRTPFFRGCNSENSRRFTVNPAIQVAH